MKRFVYLYELDSVRNSPEEIQRGQDALFEEIVKKGNTVVLSFNQLTDSEAFLCAVRDEKAYEQIVALFTLGALKISRYGNIRTPSQYIQNAIDKCNSESKEAFLFSGLPVLRTEKDFLKKIKHALQYSDTTELEDILEKEHGESEREKIKYVIRFVRMILVMSLEKISGNPPYTGEKRNFMQFYEEITEVLQMESVSFSGTYGEEIKGKMPQALKCLEEIRRELRQEIDADKIMNNRTNWVEKLHLRERTEDEGGVRAEICLAEAVIDLCYNYTVEESVCHVSRHYDPKRQESLERDLETRLSLYWKDYKEGIHRFGEEKGEQDKLEIILPPWDTAARVVLEERKRQQDLDEKKEEEKCYETDCGQEKRRWRWRIVGQMLGRLRTAFLYILIFCAVDYLMGLVEEQAMGVFFHMTGNQIVRTLWSVGCSTIMFGIIGSLVANTFQLPDILESVRSIGTGVKDLYRIRKAKSGISYENIEQEKKHGRKI